MTPMPTSNLVSSRDKTARKNIALALQGGGAWGAYTWGVLDCVLSSRTVAITQMTGTSAGAINAAIVASALAKRSPALARRSLRNFWLAVSKPAAADFGRELWGPVERQWRETVGAWLIAGNAASPYTLNPLGLNPLRDLIAANVDIEAIRSPASPALYVTVTNVRTGLPRVIGNDAITIDALLASACLPQLFQAVELDGEPYWDGGYSGNPTLWPIIDDSATRDLIVVQLVPDRAPEVPKDGASIRRRVGEIVFGSSLVAEMQAISAMRAVAERGETPASVLDLRMHRIGPPSAGLLAEGSALDRSRAWIERLYAEGRSAAKRFFGRHGAAIGVRETLDIAATFADERKPTPHVHTTDEATA